MILTELTISNVGPFYGSEKVKFEESVTVFTGANDCGKSSILNAVELLCGVAGHDRELTESDVNFDRILSGNNGWKNDTEISCKAVFKMTELSKSHVKGVEAGQEVFIECQLAPISRKVTRVRFRANAEAGWRSGGGVSVGSFPKIIKLPLNEPIRSVIDLTSPNNSELGFLKSAFDPEFSFSKIQGLSPGMFSNLLSKAKGDLNSKLRRFLPDDITLEFDFVPTDPDRRGLSVNIRDHHEGHSPLELRGAGIQSLVSVMAALTSQSLDDCHFIVLFDEPENSLHADAQHVLRAFLETLGDSQNAQIIYATHSPSMINSMRGESLRLVKRSNDGGFARSKVIERPIDENFLPVRSSLGLNASDSLLYGPVTIVVEGPTEVLGIPIIFRRLWQEGVPGFEKVVTLLPLLHILDGSGDKFDKLCKVAISQGTRPVVFLDGDKKGQRLNSITNALPNVPVVLLEGSMEFEEIIPTDVYVNSLAEVMSEYYDNAVNDFTIVKFEAWNEGANLPQQMAFSKRIDRWVEETTGLSVEKPRVMKHALSSVNVDDVKLDELKELLDKIVYELAKI